MLTALWSINERLASNNGIDLPEPTTDWWLDLVPLENTGNEDEPRDSSADLLMLRMMRDTMEQ
jgi:hypothetical protein